MSNHAILQGDCLQILPTLPPATCLWADPPDNLGLKYDGFRDRISNYHGWLLDVVQTALQHEPQVFWLSLYHKHLIPVLFSVSDFWGWDIRLFIWRFTFGQHQSNDCGNGYRPILRFSKPGFKWNTGAIRVPSARQSKYGDNRANPKGRVPDDVWEFPRVCGTFHERRAYIPNQHPIALMKRIVALSCRPGDSVIDLFGGSFSCARACQELGIDCTSIELSETYCEFGRKELQCS